MEQAEIETAVGELETRMDRLRALYDQYFMGIEKLEPLVPRKDVERRFALLRKEQIRNTGLRYKFNMLIQRFNTNTTHWVRIARQIENGTYRRDVRRAKARFGVDPTNERVAEPKADSAKEPARVYFPEAGDHEEPEDGSSRLHAVDLDDDPFGGMGAHEVPVPRERFASSLRLDIDELGQPFKEDDPFPKSAAPSSGPKIRPRAPLAAGAAESRVTIAKRASIPDEGEVVPPPPPSRPGVAPPLPPGARRREAPTLTSSNSASVLADVQRRVTLQGPGPAPDAPPERPAVVVGAPLPPGPAVRRREAPTLTSNNSASLLADVQRRLTLPHGAPLPAPAQNAPVIIAAPAPPAPASPQRPPASTVSVTVPVPGGAPRVVQRPATLSGAGFPPMGAIPPAGPSSPRAPPPPPSRPELQRTGVQSPRSPEAPAPPVVRPAAAPAPAPARPAIGDLSGARVDQIYSKYVETRRAQNEPTHAITREALAKQLTDATARVKPKHGGKEIDFEVVVKDGKTVLRPVVK